MKILFLPLRVTYYINALVAHIIAGCKVGFSVMFVLALVGHAKANQHSINNGVDLRVLVDISGSMKNTDPKNMRGVALQVLAQILPDDMNAGIWVFDGQTRVLVPLGKVDEAWRDQVLSSTEGVTAKGRFTNIQKALARGIQNASNKQQHVILLTDGKVDLSKDKVANIRSRNLLLSGFLQGNSEYPPIINTIALSSNTDQRLLSEIARQSDGLHTTAENADQLTQFFLRALDNSHTSTQLEVIQQSDGTQKVVVDKDTEQIKLVIKTDTPEKMIILKNPQGQLVKLEDAQVEIQSLDDQQIITIVNPTAGEWQIVDKDVIVTRVNVINDLIVNVHLQDTNIYTGQSTQATVTLSPKQRSDISTQDKITGNITLSITDENNKVRWRVKEFIKDASMRTGQLSVPVILPTFSQPGLYRLKTQLSLKQLGESDLSRNLFVNKYLRVHPPVSYYATVTNNNYSLSVKPLYGQLNLDNSSVTVITRNANGVKQSKNIPLSVDEWKTTWQSNQAVLFETILFKGKTFAGKPINFSIEDVFVEKLSVQEAINQQKALSVSVDSLPTPEIMAVTQANGDQNKANLSQGVSAEAPSSALQSFTGDADNSQGVANNNTIPTWAYWVVGGLLVLIILLLWRYMMRTRPEA